MRISDVLRRKGDNVVTIGRTASVADLVSSLTAHRIGAVVVVDVDGSVVGIVSERDVVHALADRGNVEDLAVADIMSTEVLTCTPQDDTRSLAETMTERRVRHMPVLEEGRLAGIVSIGDIVKQRLDELQAERDQLIDYVQS